MTMHTVPADFRLNDLDVQFDRIVAKIYSAVLDEAARSDLIKEIASIIDAVAGFYAGLDTRRGDGAFWYACNHDPRVQALYNEHFLELDPTLAHVIRSPGKAFSCAEYLTEEQVAGNPFYTHFMLPNGLRYVLSGVVSMRGSMVSFFGFQRMTEQAAFGPRETSFLQRLIPHFQIADELAAKMSKLSETKRMAIAFIDRLDYGVVFVDRAGMIRMTNQHAERWLQADDVIGAKFGRLIMRNSDDQLKLTRLITAATQPIALAEGGSLSSSASTAGPQARVVVLPVGKDEQSHLDDWETKAVVVIADVAQRRAIAPQILQETYGLTATEVKVVLGFANGQTLENLSENLGVTMNTIKAHTQHIFQKTGLHRQAELVRLVYGLPALT